MPFPTPSPAPVPADLGEDRPRSSKTGRPLSGAALAAASAPAQARLLIAIAARLLNMPGPDAVRILTGSRADTLALLWQAGMGDVAATLEAEWTGDVAQSRQITVFYGEGGYDRDPAHDPRVTDLILKGASNAEVSKMLQAVTQEMIENPKPVIGPPGQYADTPRHTQQMGVQYENGRPVQVSRKLPGGKEWSEYPDHQVPVRNAAAGDLHPAAAAQLAQQPGSAWTGAPPTCEHPGQTGRFCTKCGSELAPDVMADQPVPPEETQ